MYGVTIFLASDSFEDTGSGDNDGKIDELIEQTVTSPLECHCKP